MSMRPILTRPNNFPIKIIGTLTSIRYLSDKYDYDMYSSLCFIKMRISTNDELNCNAALPLIQFFFAIS